MFEVHRWMTAAKEKVNQATKLAFDSILLRQKDPLREMK